MVVVVFKIPDINVTLTCGMYSDPVTVHVSNVTQEEGGIPGMEQVIPAYFTSVRWYSRTKPGILDTPLLSQELQTHSVLAIRPLTGAMVRPLQEQQLSSSLPAGVTYDVIGSSSSLVVFTGKIPLNPQPVQNCSDLYISHGDVKRVVQVKIQPPPTELHLCCSNEMILSPAGDPLLVLADGIREAYNLSATLVFPGTPPQVKDFTTDPRCAQVD